MPTLNAHRVAPGDLIRIAGRDWNVTKRYSEGLVLRSAGEAAAPATVAHTWKQLSDILAEDGVGDRVSNEEANAS